jgi:hypothetical protein
MITLFMSLGELVSVSVSTFARVHVVPKVSLQCQREGNLALLQHLPNLGKLANGEFCEVRGHTTVFSLITRN